MANSKNLENSIVKVVIVKTLTASRYASTFRPWSLATVEPSLRQPCCFLLLSSNPPAAAMSSISINPPRNLPSALSKIQIKQIRLHQQRHKPRPEACLRRTTVHHPQPLATLFHHAPNVSILIKTPVLPTLTRDLLAHNLRHLLPIVLLVPRRQHNHVSTQLRPIAELHTRLSERGSFDSRLDLYIPLSDVLTRPNINIITPIPRQYLPAENSYYDQP